MWCSNPAPDRLLRTRLLTGLALNTITRRSSERFSQLSSVFSLSHWSV
jgi:hypothetical protein